MTLIKAMHPNSAAVPQVNAHSVQVGDRYLLCTDRLHLPVTTATFSGFSPNTLTSTAPLLNSVHSHIELEHRTTSFAWWRTFSRHEPAATNMIDYRYALAFSRRREARGARQNVRSRSVAWSVGLSLDVGGHQLTATFMARRHPGAGRGCR
jgi:hypothetical protein